MPAHDDEPRDPLGQPVRDDLPPWMNRALADRRARRWPPLDLDEGPDRARAVAIALLALSCLIVAGSLVFLTGPSANVVQTDERVRAPATSKPTPSVSPTEADEEATVSTVANALIPSVVQIETNAGLGSGVVYKKRGLILTAAHVLASATEVHVRLPNGRRVPGRVVGTDPRTDVAVVRATKGRFRPAKLAVGRPLGVGELAVAIGSPFGLSGSVTSGVISATERVLRIGVRLAPMIQTDAPINPGNSGGALADKDGRVIGINNAIATSTGENAGVGFAIPIDVAASVADDLVEGRKPRVGWIGIIGTDPPSGRDGALVTIIQKKGPADRAGIRRGDIIVTADHRRIRSMAELSTIVRLANPGRVIEFEVRRNGRRETFDVRIAAL
ncbi:MAG: trypsin-like peptidase domain-containing protein [Actinobacteria bacterium]|nr:trypsin-like peptidase domain-containing protein [Actinomycetota bacterium]